MKRVLLTGGLGNIGTRVIDELLSQGYAVLCFDLKNKQNQKTAKRYEKKVELIWGDITSKESVQGAINDVDAVIHNAAMLPPFSETNPEAAKKVNIDGTSNVIDAIQTGNKSTQLIFASSISVHGNHMPDHSPVRSIDDPFVPCDHYAAHKIACENMLQKSDINWTVLRISACVDEKSRVSIANLKPGMETYFSVHPLCRIEYIHPADVATAMVNAIGNKEAIRKPFFLGGGESCRSHWRELNALRFEALGLGSPPFSYFGDGGFYTEWMDTGESQRVLQYQSHNLDDYRDELKEVMKWLRRFITPVRPFVRSYMWSLSPKAKSLRELVLSFNSQPKQ